MDARFPSPTSNRRLYAERGQSMVEVAVFFTVLMVMLTVVIQAAVAVNTYLIVITAAREGARYSVTSFDYTPQQIADVAKAAAYPLPLTAERATLIVTRVQTNTSGGTPSITSYTPTYAAGLGSLPSRLDSATVLARYSQGAQVNGTDEFVIVEFFYSMPMFIAQVSIPMYSYTIMRTVGN